MKAIITGASGQDAHYLKLLLARMGIESIGVSSGSAGQSLAFDKIEELVHSVRPEYVFHFAAKSSTRHDHFRANQVAIVDGSCAILEACKVYSPKTRIFIAGSGLQFQNFGTPIEETNVFSASSAYATARIQTVYLARYFREKYGQPVFMGYLYGHDSPLRSGHFTSKLIVEGALSARRDPSCRLEVGNLSVVREFAYAADIVTGIWHFVNQPIDSETVWEANICIGTGTSIRRWADIAYRMLGLESEHFIIEKAGFVADYTSLVGHPGRMNALGWRSIVSSEELCACMLGLADEATILDRVFENALKLRAGPIAG